MTRKLPRHADIFLRIAKESGLSFPLGRALYACNRIQNGDFPYGAMCVSWIHPNTPGVTNPSKQEIVDRLKTIRPTTAQRWIKHWKSGGSIKSLSHGSAGRIR